jgi:SPP1 gp7 family putative phage head morphogenesis protein
MGKVTQESLPPLLYFKIADYLKQGVYEGFGTTWTALSGEKLPPGFNMQDKELLSELRSNIYLFSAAKTYQQIRTMSSALISDDGTIVPFKQFRENAEQTYDLFNKTWLRTEYDTAIGQAQNARKWLDIEKNADILPLLEYSAVMDKRTSDICRHLDGIIAPVNDPIWKKIAPLNHFNCRCLLLQLSEGVPTGMDAKMEKVTEAETQMDDLFKMNPGQSGYVFSKDHPYFDIAPRDRGLAMRNFDLPIPKADPPSQAKIEAPAPGGFKPAKNIKDAEERIKQLGINDVDLSKLKIDHANMVLKVFENENNFSKLKLTKLNTYKRSNDSAGAFYSPSNNSISINVSNIDKFFPKEVLTFENRIEKLNSIIIKYENEYLNNPKYDQTKVRGNINILKNDINKLQTKIKNGEKPLPFTFTELANDKDQSFEMLLTHEIGHNRHYKQTGMNVYFNTLKKDMPSDYAKTNKREYYAEMYVKYRYKGSSDIPDDILKIFENL